MFAQSHRWRCYLFGLTTGLSLAFVAVLVWPGLLRSDGDVVGAQHGEQRAHSFADAVARSAPAVVNIFASKITREQPSPLVQHPLLRQYQGEVEVRPRYHRENSLGSAVVVDQNGFLLTNHHVIAEADEIRVVAPGGRPVAVRIVGTDADTDLTVLQAAGDELPVAPFGRSADLRVGDVVLAIGNPFGVGQTVTQGIVGGIGRDDLGITSFENFIQTDAAINPGNSGGALVNAAGEVVGINTAIFSQSGGSHGIGFAIPIDLARDVLRQLIEYGRVVRGWLGISGQDLTRSEAAARGLDSADGMLVAAVLRDGPADQSGVEPGDIIRAVDGEVVHRSVDLLNLISRRRPGDQVALAGVRDGEPKTWLIRVAERPVSTRP